MAAVHGLSGVAAVEVAPVDVAGEGEDAVALADEADEGEDAADVAEKVGVVDVAALAVDINLRCMAGVVDAGDVADVLAPALVALVAVNGTCA